MRALHLASTLLLLIANSAPAAWAQQTPEGPGAAGQTDADKLAANHYLAGIRALEAGRDAEAHAELLKAWELKRHWQIAANLGEVELRLGRYGEAVEHLEHFLREAEGVREDEIRRAEGMLQEARRHVEAQRQQPAEPASPSAIAVVAQGAGGAPQGVVAASGGGGEVASGSRPLWWPAIAAAGVAFAGIGVGVGFTIAANAKDTEAEALVRDLQGVTPRDRAVCPAGAESSPATCATIGDLLEDKYRLKNAAIAGYAAGGVAAVGAAVLAIWPIRVGEGGGYVSVAPAPGPSGGALFLKGAF